MSNSKQKLIAKFFSFIILFSSCSQYDNGSDYIVDEELSELNLGLSIDEYADNHVNLTSEIYEILKQENNIDVDLLEKVESNSVMEQKEVNSLFQKANIRNHVKLTKLITELQWNIQSLLVTYESELPQDELVESFTENIVQNFNQKIVSASDKSCKDQFRQAEGRCLQNYAISVTVSIVAAGVWSFGVGSVVGIGVAVTVLYICLNDAESDLEKCQQD